jgi:beta-carotene 15,15'-dioxygenase
MAKYFTNTRFSILILGFILLCISHLKVISSSTQLVVFAVVIAFTGIPHGAMDFYLEKQNQLKVSNHFSALWFYVYYFTNMAAYAFLWYLFPSFSLVIFILLTSYHFGEIDINLLIQNKVLKIFSTLYGFFTILFIITCHINETASIIHFLIEYQYPEIAIIEFGHKIFKASIVGILIVWLILFYFNRSSKRDFLILVSQLSLVLTLVYLLPFYLGFAYYFGLWHSFLSFSIIKKHLGFTHNLRGWKEMASKMLPYSLGAILFISFAIGKVQTLELKQIIGAVFIGISIITLPHLQVFSKTINQLKN